MLAKDLMSTEVVSVTPETQVADIVKILLGRGFSAVPVLDVDGHLVGLVSEGDLMRRPETGGPRHRSWLAGILTTPEERAFDYVRTHGTKAADVMTTRVVAVGEDAPAHRIATIFEENRIKRVPVVRDGRVVGIVSRADLLRASASANAIAPVADDEAICAAVLARLRRDSGVRSTYLNVTVSDRTVHFWGGIRSEIERRAARVAAEGVKGVRAVEDHLRLISRELVN